MDNQLLYSILLFSLIERTKRQFYQQQESSSKENVDGKLIKALLSIHYSDLESNDKYEQMPIRDQTCEDLNLQKHHFKTVSFIYLLIFSLGTTLAVFWVYFLL